MKKVRHVKFAVSVRIDSTEHLSLNVGKHTYLELDYEHPFLTISGRKETVHVPYGNIAYLAYDIGKDKPAQTKGTTKARKPASSKA